MTVDELLDRAEASWREVLTAIDHDMATEAQRLARIYQPREAIDRARRAYQGAREPVVRELVKIACLRPPPICVTFNETPLPWKP